MKPKQVFFITGAKGIGKSTAAARYARPSEVGKVIVVDCEDGMNAILKSNEALGLKFGAYIRAYEQLGNEEERKALMDRIAKGDLPWVSGNGSNLGSFWEWLINKLSQVTAKGGYEYLVIDPVAPVEAACAAWAESHKKESGWRTKAYGKHEVEAIRPLLKNFLEAVYARGIHTILLTSHLRTPWVEYAPGESKPLIDKVEPSGRLKVWSTLSTAMLWLVPAYPVNSTGAPSAVVMKARVSLESKDGDEWSIQRPIPPRIPAFTWKAWRGYEAKGWNPLQPQAGETVLPHEDEMMNKLMSNEQYRLMIAYAEAAREAYGIKSEPAVFTPAIAEPKPELDEESAQIITLAEEGKTEIQIAQEVGKPLPVVVKVLREHYKEQ